VLVVLAVVWRWSQRRTIAHQNEERSRRAALYTRNLIEASLDPLVTISREGKITDVNQATETITGVKREALIGSDFSDYFTDPTKARDVYRQVFATSKVRDYPLALRNASGGVTEVLYNASVFRNEAGEVEGVFAAARDITERKQLEEQLLQSQKLEAVGQLAGGVGTTSTTSWASSWGMPNWHKAACRGRVRLPHSLGTSALPPSAPPPLPGNYWPSAAGNSCSRKN